MHNDKKELIQKIRNIVSELYAGDHYNNYPQSNLKFPYDSADDTPNSPLDIDTDMEYVAYQSQSDNNDTFEFPFDSLKRGLEIESNRSPKLSVYDHAMVAIKNIRDDKNFYSKFE